MSIQLNNNNLYTLCFANDQLVIANEYDDLEYMTQKLIEEYKKCWLKVIIGKTMSINIGDNKQNLVLNGRQHIETRF